MYVKVWPIYCSKCVVLKTTYANSYSLDEFLISHCTVQIFLQSFQCIKDYQFCSAEIETSCLPISCNVCPIAMDLYNLF